MEVGNIDVFRKFFGSLILIAAFVVTCKGGIQVFNIYQTYQWQTTEGVITSSSLGGAAVGNPLYWPQIKYKYTVSGRAYESNRYSIASTSSYAKPGPCKIVKEHQPGAKITVFYNPEMPSEAVINRFPWQSPIPILVGVVLFFFGLYVFPRLTRHLEAALKMVTESKPN